MEFQEENRTKKWILEALFDLLRYKEYHNITISKIVDKAGLGRRTFYRYFKTKDEVMAYAARLLMDDFAAILMASQASDQPGVICAYFEFWQKHIELLLLLKKARLLYFIEDDLLLLVYQVAKKVGHVPDELSEAELAGYYEQHKYAFAVKLAGLWKATVLWAEETPRKTPRQMSLLLNEILK